MDSISKRRVKVTVNDKPFLVEVNDLSASPLNVKVNGQSYVVNIETAAVEKAPADESPTALDTALPPAPTPAKTPPSANHAGASEKEVKAPMPGHIIEIAVKPGDEVSAGQTLCLLEAMKMKNAIRSPRNGVIAGIKITLGQPVTYGDILVAFE